MAANAETAKTTWKEAGVGMVATYNTPLVPESEDPARVDVRYAARMPEGKMATLITGLVDQTQRALQRGIFHYRIVLADGKHEIWRVVDEHSVFDEFTRILDFYHAAQHLSKVAEHLFGQSSMTADNWFGKWRHKWRLRPSSATDSSVAACDEPAREASRSSTCEPS
jgi:hypothetical protein